MRPPVLRERVVPPLARGASEGDDLAHGLFRHLRDDAGPHRPPPLPDREPQLLLHRHRRDQLDRHRHVVPPQHHLHPPPPHDRPRPPPPPPPTAQPTPPPPSAIPAPPPTRPLARPAPTRPLARRARARPP